MMAEIETDCPLAHPGGDIDLDDVTIQSTTMHQLSTEKGAFVNLGFSEEDDKASVSTVQAEANVTLNTLEGSLQEWNKYLSHIQQNKADVRRQIEQQRDTLLKIINEHAQSLINQSEQLIGSHEQKALTMREILTGTLEEVTTFVSSEIETLLNNENAQEDVLMLKHCRFLVKQLQNIRNKTSAATPLWLPLQLYNNAPTDYLISHLFGNVRLIDPKDYPLKYCDPLHLLRKVCTRTQQDQMPGGLVDMTVTPKGQILVCDKQNKMLKMFSREGTLEKVIKSGSLKDPNRLTFWPHNNGLLVNDNYLRFIKLYDCDGEYVQDFINNISCPTSLCVNHKGDLLVAEYETKSILVFDQDGQSKFSFKTFLAAPAHVTAGPRGHIVVTDWRHHTLKVFHVTGERAWSIHDRGSGDNQLDQPQGACFDPFGNILVADSNNHRIQCFSDEGTFIKTVISKSAGLKLPVAVQCDANGFLYVAEYQGFVKIFKYLQHEEQTLEQVSTDETQSPARNSIEDETAL